MTKQHYIAIAEILNNQLHKSENPAETSHILEITANLAEYFKEENQLFNKERFFQAVKK